MDNYEAMNFYYGLLNLHAGVFKPNLCEILMLVAQSVPETSQPAAAYQPREEATPTTGHEDAAQLTFGSFYDDGHILHNVKIDTQSDFFLDPTRGDTVKWHVSFTVAKDVRPADQFIVQLSDNLIVAANGHPRHPIADYVDQDGVVIAMGDYQPDKHQLVYTFTNYVTDHRQIVGKINGELSIDPVTVPENEFGMRCYIEIDKYRRDFTIDVDYPDLSNDTFLGISSRMMSFDQDRQLFTDLLYVNAAEKKLDHGYLIFNTSEMVEELSNAIVSPTTMRIEVFQNARHLKLPQSYGVDLRRLRNVTNRFPIVKGDHLVATPWTILFADNKMRLNLGADDSNDSYVIKIVGQYNDELDGAVRLRARLFGVDDNNVYMSNSTDAAASETLMTVTGSAVAKEGRHAEMTDDVNEGDFSAATVDPDAPYDELAPGAVDQENGWEDTSLAGEAIDADTTGDAAAADPESSAYIISFDDETAGPAEQEAATPAHDGEEAESNGIDVTDLEDEAATDYDRRFAKLLKKNMAKAANSDAEVAATPTPVPPAETGHEVVAMQPTEVFLPKTSTAPASDQPIVTASEEGEDKAVEVAEEQPQAATVATEDTTPTPVVVVTEDPISDEDLARTAVEVSEEPVADKPAEEEPAVKQSAAPLPMPSRRPPRRVGRFERYQRGSSLRHLRRR